MANIKRKTLSALLVALFACVIGLCSASFTSAKAYGEIELESYNIVDTTWIRSEAPEGLRFQLEYSTEDKDSLSENAFFGALLIPQTMLNGDLTVDTENVLKIKAGVNVVDYNKEGYEAFNVVLLGSNGTNLDRELYTTPIVIRGVVVDGDKVGYTQNVVVKSIAQVAQYLILEGDKSAITAQYTAGLEAQLTAEKTNILAGETLATSFTFANMPVKYKTLNISYSSSAPEIADVDAQTGVITGTGNGEAVITATATSIATGNKMTASLTVTSTKEAIEVTEFVTFSAKDSTEYTFEGLKGEVISIILNDGTQDLVFESATIAKEELPVGYYDIKGIETTTTSYTFTKQLVVADKVLTTADEFQNWAKYIRPKYWNRGTSYTELNSDGKYNNIYDGLIVLGNDIDFGGQVYKTELATMNLGINGTWWLDTTTGEIYTEEVEGKSNLTIRYAGIFVGTFDGLGHTVYDIEVAYFGSPIFGHALSGTVKNVAFTQVKYSATVTANGGTLYNNATEKTDNNGILHQFEVYNIFLEGGFDTELTGDYRLGFVGGPLNTGDKKYQFHTIATIVNSTASNTSTTGVVFPIVYGNAYKGTAIFNESLHAIGVDIAKNNAHLYSEYTALDSDTARSAFKSGGFTLVDNNKFPTLGQSKNYLTPLNLSAKDINGNYVQEVLTGSTTQLFVSNYKTYSSVQALLNLNTLSLAEDYEGITLNFDDLTLTVDSTVASGTEIVIIYTNVISGNTGTITLVATEFEMIVETLDVNELYSIKSTDNVVTDIPVVLDGVDGIVSVELTNNETNEVYAFTGSSIVASEITSGYYTVIAYTAERGYRYQATIADKVIYTAEEFQNWAKYIRPTHWNRGNPYTHSDAGGTYNIYDGLIVLGNDIDFGGQVYKTELATMNLGINGTWYLDEKTGEIYTEKVEGKTNLTNRYAAIFVGTFDGLGHTVYDIEIGYFGASIFGNKLAGTVRNVGFAQVKYSAPQISGNFGGVLTGSGTSITNNGVKHNFAMTDVFVEGGFNYDIAYATANDRVSFAVGTVNGSIAYVFARIAVIVNLNPTLSAGSYGRNTVLTYGNGSLDGATSNKSLLLGLHDGNNITSNATGSQTYAYAGAKWSDSYELWDTTNFPIMLSAKDHLTVLDFNETQVSVGANKLTIKGFTTYTMGAMKNLWTVVSNTEGVTFDLATCTLTVADTVAVGTEITLTVTSVINSSLTNTITFVVA